METTMTPMRTSTLHFTSRRQCGFTLLEVLISIVVITIGLISMLGAFGVAMAATQTARQDMVAKQLAQEAMESIVTGPETAHANSGPVLKVWGGGTPRIF